MGLPGKRGPLGEKWEKKRKNGEPTWADVGGAAAPPWPANHVGLVTHGLAKGKASPSPLYKGRLSSPFRPSNSLSFIASLTVVPVVAAQEVENSIL